MHLAITGLGMIDVRMLHMSRSGVEVSEFVHSDKKADTTGSLIPFFTTAGTAGIKFMGHACDLVYSSGRIDFCPRIKPVYVANITAKMALNHDLFR
jgi:hypothetical protein